MNRSTAPTHVVSLHLAGPISVAKQTLRRICLPGGLCVTIEPEVFIYAGGEETGYRVGFVNYPRFPLPLDRLMLQAEEVLRELIEATHQHSGLLVGPEETVWLSRRRPEVCRV